MQNHSLNLVSALAVLRKRWYTVFFFVAACMAVAVVTVFLVPPYFRSRAIVVSANTVLADKARLFNPNIQHLYSYFGSGDDLDRIVGLGEMDATYRQLIAEFDLVKYYQLSGDSSSVLEQKAIRLLRRDLRFLKNENAQLEIVAWTKNQSLSAKLVNRMIGLVEVAEKNIWKKNYNQAKENLDHAVGMLEEQYRALADSQQAAAGAQKELSTLRAQALLEELKQYRKTAAEYMIAAQDIPEALYVLEPATPAAYAQRPDKPAVLFATLIASSLLGCMVVWVGERKNFP